MPLELVFSLNGIWLRTKTYFFLYRMSQQKSNNNLKQFFLVCAPRSYHMSITEPLRALRLLYSRAAQFKIAVDWADACIFFWCTIFLVLRARFWDNALRNVSSVNKSLSLCIQWVYIVSKGHTPVISINTTVITYFSCLNKWIKLFWGW